MKSIRYTLMLGCWVLSVGLSAQQQPTQQPFVIDTLLKQDFESEEFDVPLSFPNGNDTVWVNYDADGATQQCFEGQDSYGWYPSLDESDPSSQNYTYGSCSLTDFFPTYVCQTRNYNWLITPPITITEANALLTWRSLSYYGPFVMDGYKVLVSTTTNLPTAFTDTLFKAAEHINSITPNLFFSLNPADHIFSTGYIHANGYTDANYFVEDVDASATTFLRGKLEPHEVNLGQYTGQTIYLAFLHDSDCDFFIQIDDILVLDGTTAVAEVENIHDFKIMGNPVRERILFSLTAADDMPLSATLTDMAGKLHLQEQIAVAFGSNNFHLEIGHLPAGVYQLSLSNGKGVITRKVVKLNY